MTPDPIQPPPSSTPIPILSYATETKSKHDQNYTRLLAALAFFFLIAIITTLSLASRFPESESRWVLRMVALCEGCYLAAMVATLIARLVNPVAGRQFTKVLNIMLLPYFPLGTALATYGFMKVDK